MKKIHLVNLGTEEEPDLVGCESEIDAQIVADICMGVIVDTLLPVYETTDPIPHIRSVHWCSFFFHPARDENRHELVLKPGEGIVTEGTEEALDIHIHPPTVQTLSSYRGWSVIATGYPSPREARVAAHQGFTEELHRRGKKVSNTRLGVTGHGPG